MQLRIVHETRYDYSSPVVLSQHMAHLCPLHDPDGPNGQRLLDHTLRVTPLPTQTGDGVDSFGNRRAFFALQEAHDQLDVVADSLVDTQAPQPLPASPPWQRVREHFVYRAGAAYEAASEFGFASPYVPVDDTLADYARDLFTDDAPLLEACEALMARIHRDFTYRSGSTEVNTPVLEALERREGVCQDFAHVMIGCLRSLGLPARYVSGYLLTVVPEGQQRLVGADASHAWVSVYAPALDGVGPGSWCDFDPTNDRCGWGSPGEDYVTLAYGRDFGDVSPLRGVIQGGGSHNLHVGVTVAPPEEHEALNTAV